MNVPCVGGGDYIVDCGGLGYEAYSLAMHWVIGDVHGMLRPLQALVAAIVRRDPASHLVFAGDYVNRGPDSRGVIDFLLTASNATFLRGNHDDIFDLLLHNDCYICHSEANDPVSAFTWFMQHGLAETLLSYGADWAELESVQRRPGARRVAELAGLVPEAHRDFIRKLRPVFETSDFFVAHGFWDPNERDDAPSLSAKLASNLRLRHRLLWGRFSESQIASKKRWRRHGFFGHTPVTNYGAGLNHEPVRGPRIVLLDTAVALSAAGMLSGVCAESGTVLQASRAGDVAELP